MAMQVVSTAQCRCAFGTTPALLTAQNPTVMGRLIPRIEFIAPVKKYPGEDELGALAAAGMAVVSGRRPAQEYTSDL